MLSASITGINLINKILVEKPPTFPTQQVILILIGTVDYVHHFNRNL